MGQYYMPVLLEDSKINGEIKAWAYSHDYGNGLKLMEHSYIGNVFVARIEMELIATPTRIAWCGDYADPEEIGPHAGRTLYAVVSDEENIEIHSLQLPYKLPVKTEKYRYIVNHTKKLFVDKCHMVKCARNWNWKIHPLPLLTAEGNGRGGGDYHGPFEESLVGSWARDLISVETSFIRKYGKDFKELVCEFTEEN